MVKKIFKWLGIAISSARNLPKGEGGLAAGYTTSDWMRALEHGIAKNGKPLLFMPSHEITRMTKNDLASLIAYYRQVASCK